MRKTRNWIFFFLAMALVAFFTMPMAIAHNREGPFTPAEVAFAKTDLTLINMMTVSIVVPSDPGAWALSSAAIADMSHDAVFVAKPDFTIVTLSIIVTPTNQGSLAAQAATIAEKRMSQDVAIYLTFPVAIETEYLIVSFRHPFCRTHDPTMISEPAQGTFTITLIEPLLTSMTPIAASHRPNYFMVDSINTLALRKTILANWRTPSYHLII